MKEHVFKINGVEQTTENLENLNNSLEKVDVKMKKVSVSAKDVADTYKNDFKEVMEYLAVQMSKMGAIVAELNTHIGTAIEKNVEAGEKLAESMTESAESGLSSVKIKAIEASSLIEAWIDKVNNRSEEQSAKLAEQVTKNKELLERDATIKKEYDDKDKETGILNLKAHKENIEKRIEGLQALKTELEAATANTRLQYDVMSIHYKSDSEEFKKIQEDKKNALEALTNKIVETNNTLKESNVSYWETWKKQQAEIGTEIEKFGANVEKKTNGEIDKFTEKITQKTKGVTDFINKYSKEYDKYKTETLEGLKAIDEQEKIFNEKKYDGKLEKLEKERKELRKEITETQKKVEEAEKIKSEALAKKAKIEADDLAKVNDYDSKIKKIKDAFKINDDEVTADPPKDSEDTAGTTDKETKVAATNLPTDTLTDPSTDSESGTGAGGTEGETGGGDGKEKKKPKPPTEEEKQAALDKVKELEQLRDAVKTNTEELTAIVDAAATTIEEGNVSIIESERSVLLEEMQIDDEKKKLEEKKSKRLEDIDARDQKRKDKLAKLEEAAQKVKKLKEKAEAKIQAVRDIAIATKDIASGVAKAWKQGPILGPALAALVALNGVIQLKTMTAQLAKFEDGGLLNGKRHSQGGMRIEGTNMEVEGGEFVVNRVSTDKNLGLVKYINEQRRELSPSDLNTYFSRSSQIAEPSFKRMFAEGGQLPAVEPVANIDNENLIKAIQSIRIEPKVAVTDIAKVQDSMVSVDGWAGV